MDDDFQLHSTLGPSVAHRYRRCPGSVALEATLPNEAGMEAAQGTVFHHFAAICLETGLDPDVFVGHKLTVEGHGVLEMSLEMANKMQSGLDYARALIEPGDVVLVEQRVSLEPWLGPNQFGTSDLAIISLKNWKAIIWDWKWGAGVPVSPIENDQGILYGLGVWNDHLADMIEGHMWSVGVEPGDGDSFETFQIQIIIEQPRAPGGGGEWTISLAELLRRGEHVKKDAAKTYDPNAPRIPGPKQCQFCMGARKNVCKEHADFLLSKFDAKMDELSDQFKAGEEMPLPRALTPEQRSQLLLHKPMIEKWLDRLHADAYEDAENGRPVPGMKLVEGRRSPRSWINETKAATILKATPQVGDPYTHKLLTPAQVEDIVGRPTYRKRFESLAALGDAKPQLVVDEDNREARATRQERFDAALGASDATTLI